MSSQSDRRVFISYARKDGAELARRLEKDLAAKGFEPWLDTNRISGGAVWTEEIERAIDRSQVVLALLTKGSFVSDICRAEQLRSLRKAKSVIPLLGQTGTDIPLHLETKHYRDFTAAEKYRAQFRLLVEDIGTGKNAVQLSDKFRTTYVTAPPLPRNYITRPDAVLSIRNRLITDDPGFSIALSALRGMAGIGKTILALALCHDDVVQDAFPDGIIWSTAGKKPAYDLITRMREVRRALGGDLADQESEPECINRYRTLIRDKAVLVIVDDVWSVPDIEPFLAESPRSRLLFTTRDASISDDVGAEEYTAELLTYDQSRALLGRWAGLRVADLPLEAGDLVRECGRLPLALSMVGAMLRGKPSAMWTQVHSLLRDADLEKIKAQFPNYPHPDLLRAIQVSVNALDKVARSRYLDLAVVLDDMPVSPSIQQTLWNLDALQALSTAEKFVRLSLAQREDKGGAIRLHDLQLDYVRGQFPDRDALDLIHGAVRLSSNVIAKDPDQFTSQIVGRLLLHQKLPAIAEFMKQTAEGAHAPWLRSIQPTLDPPGTGLLRTLTGHSDMATAVAVTPNGQRAVSTSYDRTLKVWDLTSGHELRTLTGHSGAVRAVAVTPDGHRAVSASYDRTLKVWDLTSGHELRTLTGHSNWVTAVVVTPDGQRAVSASYDRTLKVWDLGSGRVLRTLAGHSNWITAVAVTPDGERAVSASYDQTLKVWYLGSGRELHTLTGHSGLVTAVATTPDGQQAVSASDDGTLKVWDLARGRELRTLTGHRREVNAVAVTPDGQRAVSASHDRTLKVWDLASGLELHTLTGHLEGVRAAAVTPDGRRAVSASNDQTLKVWDLAGGRGLRTLAGHSRVVTAVAATPDGQGAVSASHDQTLKVWNLAGGRELRTLAGHSDVVSAVAVTPDGQRAISASYDRTLKVWDLASGLELHTLTGHSGLVTAVATTPDGQQAVSASDDGTLKVWDLDRGRELRTLTGHRREVNAVAVTPDGQRAVSASRDRTLRVWDLASGLELHTLTGHSGQIRAVAVTPDGQRAVSASDDCTLKVWDLASGLELRTLTGHSNAVTALVVTPDGKRVISACRDNTLKMWGLETAEAFTTFTCDGAPTCCAFSDSLKLIVAGDAGGHVHFLHVEEPKPHPQ